MNKKFKIIVPAAILGVFILIALLIRANPPEGDQRPAPVEKAMAVTAIPVQKQDYQIHLQSYGTVQPRTRTTLTTQVSGQIVFVNPNVRDGGFFEKGDVLASVDARDYEANVLIAEAVLMDAHQRLAEMTARSNQAREDWEKLGNQGEPPALVLQLPQLEAAKASVISAKATLEKAKLELERTRIIAPYAGRVLQKNADIGQVVSANSSVAEIYATDYVEIRLPIRNRDLKFIDLPETYRGSKVVKPGMDVRIISDLAGDSTWDAKLIRTEGAIDETARQLHVIAQIDDPFSGASQDQPQLKIGQYVTAEMTGTRLSDALVIPNATIYQGSYVYVAENGLLQRRNVEIAWQNEDEAVISAGLDHGDLLVTTPLGQVTSGVRIEIEANDQRILDQQRGKASPTGNLGDDP